jgi:quercetin dioxygenase-like cupin family protein
MPTSSPSEDKPRAPRANANQKPGGYAVMSKSPVAFMDNLDIGKLHVPASQRVGRQAIAAYSDQDGVDADGIETDGSNGVDTIKVLMATDSFVMFEAARPKGALDEAHIHPDHHAVVFLKKGRVRMMIDHKWYTIEEGDSYFHPLGVVHQHEPLVDCIRVETKIFPNGGAIEAWNKLLGDSPASGLIKG